MTNLLPYIINICIAKGARYKVHAFPSGAFMIDIWLAKNFYVIQIDGDIIGLSLINTAASSFDTIPDKVFNTQNAFKVSFQRIFDGV